MGAVDVVNDAASDRVNARTQNGSSLDESILEPQEHLLPPFEAAKPIALVRSVAD